MKSLFEFALGAIVFSSTSTGQTSILAVDIENIVIYNQDTADVTKWAGNPDRTDALASPNFTSICAAATARPEHASTISRR